jgi:hypothetical protein
MYNSLRNKNGMQSRLFLVCPDCFMERKIRQHFEGDNYFLTALGGVFQPASFEYAEEVNELLSRNDIREICIVNDNSCTFTRNVVNGKNSDCTVRAEEVLKQVYRGNPRTFSQAPDKKEKQTRLARLNIIRQAIQLRDTAYIGERIQSEGLRLKGFVYDRERDCFEESSTTF